MLNSTYIPSEQSPMFSPSASKISPKNYKISQGISRGRETTEDSSTAAGFRNMLLAKCKQTIEELHFDLEFEKKHKIDLEHRIARLETQGSEKDQMIRELSQRSKELQEDKQELHSQIFALQTKVDGLQTELEISKNQEKGYQELEENFQEVCKANNAMKVKIDELNAEIWSRDKVVTEWNQTLSSIDNKIAALEADKLDLTQENNELVARVSYLQQVSQDTEKLNQLLKGKCEFSEKLTQQLEKENKLLEDVRSENQRLREEIAKKEQAHKLEKQEADAKLRENHYRELDESRKTHLSEMARFQNESRVLNLKFEHLTQERDHLAEQLKVLQDKVRDNEREARALSENFNQKLEKIQITKIEDINKLQGIINEQSELIASYEKIIQNEGNSTKEKINSLTGQVNRDKDEIFSLKAKNNYLSTKLEECQEELSNIQHGIKETLLAEEGKRRSLNNAIVELEKENRLKEENLASHQQENHELKSAIRKSKNTLEFLEQERIKLNEDLLKLQNENQELKDQQKEFNHMLHSKLEEITKELKVERERRVEAEYLCTDLKEQIFKLEGILKSNTVVFNAQVIKKEQEIEDFNLQKRVESAAERKKITDNLRKRIEHLDQSSRSPRRVHQQEYSFTHNNKFYDESSRQGTLHDQEIIESKRTDTGRPTSSWEHVPREARGSRQNNVIKRFRNVLDKLEAKVERIATDMGNKSAYL